METMILYVHSESSWDVVLRLENWIRTFQFTERIKIYEDVNMVNKVFFQSTITLLKHGTSASSMDRRSIHHDNDANEEGSEVCA
jgi:hypothetical protein